MQELKQQADILIIVASTRPGRIGRAIGDWVNDQAAMQQSEEQFELVDLAEWNLPLLDEPVPPKAQMYQHEHTKAWSAKIAGAKGFIIVTPEYNHGYPAPLKNALDYLYHEWAGKPVAFVGYGYGGGRMAVQQLQQVVEELGMQPLPEQVGIAFEHGMFDEQHKLVNPDESLAKHSDSLQTLVQALVHQLNTEKIYETVK